jgi:hypothetical protein
MAALRIQSVANKEALFRQFQAWEAGRNARHRRARRWAPRRFETATIPPNPQRKLPLGQCRRSSTGLWWTTTIYVTHDQVEAMGMGDRIAVMIGNADLARAVMAGLGTLLPCCPSSPCCAQTNCPVSSALSSDSHTTSPTGILCSLLRQFD